MLSRQRPAPKRAGRFLFGIHILVAIAVCCSTAFAAPANRPRIQVPGRIVLPRIRLQDILIGPDVQSSGSTALNLDLVTPTVDAGLTGSAGSGLYPEVVRRVDSLWRIRFRRNDPKPLGFDVSYTVQSQLGVLGTLGSRANPSTTVDVDVVGLGVQTTLRPQGQMDVEEDVEFRFQSVSLQESGRYSGDLLITVNFL